MDGIGEQAEEIYVFFFLASRRNKYVTTKQQNSMSSRLFFKEVNELDKERAVGASDTNS